MLSWDYCLLLGILKAFRLLYSLLFRTYPSLNHVKTLGAIFMCDSVYIHGTYNILGFPPYSLVYSLSTSPHGFKIICFFHLAYAFSLTSSDPSFCALISLLFILTPG